MKTMKTIFLAKRRINRVLSRVLSGYRALPKFIKMKCRDCKRVYKGKRVEVVPSGWRLFREDGKVNIICPKCLEKAQKQVKRRPIGRLRELPSERSSD